MGTHIENAQSEHIYIQRTHSENAYTYRERTVRTHIANAQSEHIYIQRTQGENTYTYRGRTVGTHINTEDAQ